MKNYDYKDHVTMTEEAKETESRQYVDIEKWFATLSTAPKEVKEEVLYQIGLGNIKQSLATIALITMICGK